MELKLVYRVLRKISDWTVAGYYSETCVEGQENIPAHGPLIIAATHHNEMIDIATLAATMPHRRRVAFWAKSTMFANPVSGAILSSSGAIPVRRNPNNGSNGNGNGNGSAASGSSGASSEAGSSTGAANQDKAAELAQRSVLFRDTSKALAADGVVGVFPEGTSYTQASIVQVMPGAAWAAVEFARYMQRGEGGTDVQVGKGIRLGKEDGDVKGKGKEKEVEEVKTGLRIVPVSVVYTDKSKYQSRIAVRYGKPILMDSYLDELLEGDPDEASRAVVKKIMGQVEKQLREMTINAPDWDTLCAVSMARSILWEDERNVPLNAWVEVSQRLIKMFDLPPDCPPSEVESVRELKKALTKYYALLHYSGIKHSILSSLLPLSSSSSLLDVPPPHALPLQGILLRPTLSILKSLPLSLIRLVLFIPPLLLHFPGYITGKLSQRLATKGEEESPAQFKAIGGGVGIGANIALSLGVLWKQNKLGTLSALLGLGDWTQDDGRIAYLKRLLGVVGTVYCSVLVLVRWHKLLVNANYRQLQRIMTFCKLVSAFAFSRAADTLSATALEPYTTPPLPAVNVFIKRIKKEGLTSSSSSDTSLVVNGDSEVSTQRKQPAPIAARKLVRHLLHARTGACVALSSHLKTLEDKTLLKYLTSKGAKLSV
uniref:Phospholipid/glycerol acyltransferase domain-containing protein n=1 Tax=Psilocybe cubensis TaxID=181762 RepID=A0A8H7XV31_PSICU